jgi:predicted RNA-binding protein with PUA-like domain
MNYFLAKTDPDTYSIDDLEREKKTAWDGVVKRGVLQQDDRVV